MFICVQCFKHTDWSPHCSQLVNIRISTVRTLLTVNIIELNYIKTIGNMVGHEMLHQQSIF